MKTLITLAILLFTIPAYAEVKPLNFAWEQEIAFSGQCAGWTLYWSETSGSGYQKLIDIDFVEEQTSYTDSVDWSTLPRKKVYFVLTARSNLNEESGYSEECVVDLSILPIPINFRLVIGE